MRILGIHYFAPPVAVVASRRLVNVYRELAQKAESIDILTAAHHAERLIEPAYDHGFQLHFVTGKGLRETIYGKQKSSVASRVKQNPVFRWLNRWRQSYPFLLLTDEGGTAYYRNAIKAASKLIHQKGITHIVSSYRPWVDHRIAAALKKQFPQLVWIADFRDLPVDKVRQDVALAWLQKRWTKSIIQTADEVWVVSQGQQQQLAAYHTNIRVVYHGLDSLPQHSQGATSPFFTIGYTGSLYPDLQSIDMLAKAFVHLHNNTKKQAQQLELTLDYVGKDGEYWKKWLGENSIFLQICEVANIHIGKPASLQKTQQKQATNTLNLLLTWSAPNYHGVLTAKLFDYLAAGRPILAIVNGPDDPELRQIIEGSNAGRVFCQGQEKALQEWLQELYESWLQHQKRLPWITNIESLKQLTMAEQLKKLP